MPGIPYSYIPAIAPRLPLDDQGFALFLETIFAHEQKKALKSVRKILLFLQQQTKPVPARAIAEAVKLNTRTTRVFLDHLRNAGLIVCEKKCQGYTLNVADN